MYNFMDFKQNDWPGAQMIAQLLLQSEDGSH